MCAKPRIQAGRFASCCARSPDAMIIAEAPSEIGEQSCLRSGDDEVRLGQQLRHLELALHLRVRDSRARCLRSRAATSAIWRSRQTTPFSRHSRAWSAAMLIASGQSGVTT